MSLYLDLMDSSGVKDQSRNYSQDERKEMWRAWSSLVKELRQYRSAANKQQSVERMTFLKAQIRYHADLNNFVAKIEETKGKDRRTAVNALQRDIANLRTTKKDLATARSAYNDAAMRKARKQFRTSSLSGVSASAEAYAVLFDDVLFEGVLSETDPSLPNVMDQAFKEFGDWRLLTDTTLKNSAARYQATADAARQHQMNVAKEIQASEGSLDKWVDKLRAGEGPISEEELTEVRGTMLTMRSSLSQAAGKSPKAAQFDLDAAMEDDRLSKRIEARADDLEARLFGGDADNWWEQRGKIIADPAFQEWAKDHGFNIGKATVREVKDAEGNIISTNIVNYVEGREDLRAIIRYNHQLQSPNSYGPLTFDRGRTGEYVKLRLKATEDNLGFAENYRLSDGRIAVIKQDDGDLWFLTEEQLKSVQDSRTPRVYISDVGEGADETGAGGTYIQVRDAKGAPKAVYKYSEETGEWEVTEDDVTGAAWLAATLLNDDGETDIRYLTPSDLTAREGERVDEANIGYIIEGDPKSDAIAATFKENIPDVTYITDPATELNLEEVPGIVYSGMRQRYHAWKNLNLGPGAVGLFTGVGNGEVWAAPDQILDMTVLQEPSTTRMADVASRRIGINAQRKAIELESGPGRVAPEEIHETERLGVKVINMGSSRINIWDTIQSRMMRDPGVEPVTAKVRRARRKELREENMIRRAEALRAEAKEGFEEFRKAEAEFIPKAKELASRQAELQGLRATDADREAIKTKRGEVREARKEAVRRPMRRALTKAERQASLAAQAEQRARKIAGAAVPPTDVVGGFEPIAWEDLSEKEREYVALVAGSTKEKPFGKLESEIKKAEDRRADAVLQRNAAVETGDRRAIAGVDKDVKKAEDDLQLLRSLAHYAAESMQKPAPEEEPPIAEVGEPREPVREDIPRLPEPPPVEEPVEEEKEEPSRKETREAAKAKRERGRARRKEQREEGVTEGDPTTFYGEHKDDPRERRAAIRRALSPRLRKGLKSVVEKTKEEHAAKVEHENVMLPIGTYGAESVGLHDLMEQASHALGMKGRAGAKERRRVAERIKEFESAVETKPPAEEKPVSKRVPIAGPGRWAAASKGILARRKSSGAPGGQPPPGDEVVPTMGGTEVVASRRSKEEEEDDTKLKPRKRGQKQEEVRRA